MHLNDKIILSRKDEAGFDKLYKIRPLIDILSKLYLGSYKPNAHQNIDESIVKFKNQNRIRHYMPLYQNI